MSKSADTDDTKIVSSQHLATAESWPLSEVEYGLTLVYNAFSRWIVRCAAATGYKDFNSVDVLILHNINHRNREKRLSDISLMLNIEDAHTTNYSIKKLAKLNLVTGKKRGKEIFYSTTDEGKKVCEDYRKIREKCLLSGMKNFGGESAELVNIASFLRSLSGVYDQASRAAASL